MGWTAPYDWVASEVPTADLFNTHIRDNLRYLKGLDGDITFSDDILFTSTQTVDGMDISAHAAGDAYTQHSNQMGEHTHQSSGAQGNTLDHGATFTAASLLDDDHTQYVLKSTLTNDGDIYIMSGGTVTRLAIGAEVKVLTVVSSLPAWSF